MHTPGPWRAVPMADPAMAGRHGFEIVAGDVYVAATYRGLPQEEEQANAHMLAASQDMYDALGAFLAGAPAADSTATAAMHKARGGAA